MDMEIVHVEVDHKGVASWFVGSYTYADSTQQKRTARASFEILEVIPHLGNSSVTLWCVFNEWGMATKDLEVGLVVSDADTAWKELQLAQSISTTQRPIQRGEFVGHWAQFGRWAHARQLSTNACVVPVERLFLVTHWLLMSDGLVDQMPQLKQLRATWYHEQQQLAEALGEQAQANPYAYSMTRLGSRINPLLAVKYPWNCGDTDGFYNDVSIAATWI